MQHVTGARSWHPHHGGRRPRVLVEAADRALAVSDFSAFAAAGFDVAFCPGPGDGPASCPLLAGGECDLVAGADVVLQRLQPELGVAAAVRRRRPELPVVVECQRRTSDPDGPLPAGCVGMDPSCSVDGQLEALRRALAMPPG